MEKAYIKCQVQEGNRTDVLNVLIPLSNGSVSSGKINKIYFNKRRELETKVVEIRGGKITVILPQPLQGEDVITIMDNQLAS